MHGIIVSGRQRVESVKISDEGSLDDPTDPKAEAEGKTVQLPESQSNAKHASVKSEDALLKSSAIKGELTDPDESNSDIRKLVKMTHENLEKKPDHEIVIILRRTSAI